MLAKHRGLAITPEQRLRFVTLLSRAADDAGLPDDPEFRAALMGYAEWGTRLAVHNSQPGAEVAEHAPVPRWGWGVAPPYIRLLRSLEGRMPCSSLACCALPAAVLVIAVAGRRAPRDARARRRRRRRRATAEARPPPTATPAPLPPAGGPGSAVGVTEFNPNLVASPADARAAGAVGRRARRARRDPAAVLPARDRLVGDPAVGRRAGRPEQAADGLHARGRSRAWAGRACATSCGRWPRASARAAGRRSR